MFLLRRAIRGLLLIAALTGALGSPFSRAVQPDEILSDSSLEGRARALSRELRCMVCQNQSIDDSDAPLARDLRLLVRERLKAGDSDAQVLDFLTARYGQFVLLKPQFVMATALLWLAPAALLLIGLLTVRTMMRRRAADRDAASGEAAPLTPAEHARLSELVGRPGQGSADRSQTIDIPR